MLVGDLADTLMNVVAFAFIGAMIWIYRRPLAPPEEPTPLDDGGSTEPGDK